MRYTTVIDISSMPVYKNVNARLVYLHLALRAGYHDDDRDLVEISLRRLAADVGITLSATRHAVAHLERARLISRQGPVWSVKKWILESPITSRPKSARQQKAIEDAARRQHDQEQREREAAIEQQRREMLASQGKTSFMVYYEDLLRKAALGDQEAAKLAERRKSTYEAHVKSFNEKSK